MLNFNYIEAFFGIKDAIITKIENHFVNANIKVSQKK